MSKLKECAREVLEDIDVKEGDIIFDCCCGSGTHTIPAAKLVGEIGRYFKFFQSR